TPPVRRSSGAAQRRACIVRATIALPKAFSQQDSNPRSNTMKKSILIAGTAIVLAAQPLPAVLAQSGTPTPPMAEQPVQENQAQPQQNEGTQAELGEQDRMFVEEAS